MTLHRHVIESAVRYPERLAVAGMGRSLRYGELDRGADEFAHRLASLGVGRGSRVVIWADKSPLVVVAMQAVLRLGAVYVPQDGTAPVARVAVVAEDCDAWVVCTTRDRLSSVSGLTGRRVLCLEQDGEPLGDVTPVNEPVTPDEPAYILYTSGSTGTPKGVCVSHRNANAFVDWAVALLDVQPGDRLANHAPMVFDLSVLDLYAAFAAGASVHLVPAELAYAPVQLVRFLHQENITVWYSVPSALILMIRDGGLLDEGAPAALRAVLFAGEPFPVSYVRRLTEWTDARLLNLYGPTETNVCTFHEVEEGDLRRDRPVPIGAAASGDIVWAVRPDGTVAGPGDEGELLVDGPTVMIGYWGREPQRGPYRTGDIVRVLPDGSFDYVGRRDHSVKVRGHRIELGEVEATLTTHSEVDDAAVILTGHGIEARLTAFVVPTRGRSPGPMALRRHCAERLPSYALADHIHLVAELPRTGNGKVDRTALVRRHGELVKERESVRTRVSVGGTPVLPRERRPE